MDFAQLTFQGRLTDDPVLRTYGAGDEVCKFTVACNRPFGKGQEKTAFIPTTVFGAQARLCAEYLTKGREVQVTGDFETDSYVDNKGIQRRGFDCIARYVRFGRGGTAREGADKPGNDRSGDADLTGIDADTIEKLRRTLNKRR